MSRKILLVEPNYKNKYPPMGLMKLSTYHKMLGDEVTFYKGDLKQFVIEQIYEELIKKLYVNDNTIDWTEYRIWLLGYIQKGLSKNFDKMKSVTKSVIAIENIKYYREYYKKKRYLETPKWDRICITTLFTFYWEKTVETINFLKPFCKDLKEIKVGGIAASVNPDQLEKETGIKPFVGLLDKGGEYDADNNIVIDHLPLDYSILEEIDYVYPEHDGYYGYMTRGCVNKCPFCAVPKIEPTYCSYINLSRQIEAVNAQFGAKRNLLLLDNNVLASDDFSKIIDEIKSCGFDKKTKYIEPNKYLLTIQGLRSGYNDKGYIRSMIKQYQLLLSKQKDEAVKDEIYQQLKANKLTSIYTVRKEHILKLDEYFAPLFEKLYKSAPKDRYVDFNQGVDARILSASPDKAKKLAEIPIRPLRVAFDDWKLRKPYEKAIRLAAENGITSMSNYLLYNYKDAPVDLYRRLKLNVELCEELGVSIYSFPMKYHPIDDPDYFRNRFYTGELWNRKFIRAIQAVLNSTKGKIGKGKSFFEEAFGCNEAGFEKLLYMPEAMIIYRFYFKDSGVTEEWWQAFSALPDEKMEIIKPIIHRNVFNNIEQLTTDAEVLNVLHYYTIRREDAEKVLNSQNEVE